MKKSLFAFVITVLVAMALSACSGNDKEAAFEPKLTAKEMTDRILEQVEQPAMAELSGDEVAKLYRLDPVMLEEYSIRVPLMNTKTNEVAVLKVKDANDLDAVQEAIEKRAEDVQKQFESYLPDQYENAKNYKLTVKGPYVLFVISDQADAITQIFDGFFDEK